MRRLSFRPPAVLLAIAAGALAFAACSDSPISPTRSLRSSDADFSVVAGPGPNQSTIASNAGTLYCVGSQLNGDTASAPATFAAAGCGAGTLSLGGNAVSPATGNATPGSPLASYNPGWSAPFTGSEWIGITTKGGPSSDYRPNPGRYVFQESFNIPASVTAPVLDLHVKSDNVVGVYLNGKLIGAQPNTDCNAAPCNWNIDTHIVYNVAADFVIGGSNTLTFRVVDLPTGYPVLVGPTGGPAPQFGCPTRPFQVNGTIGFGGPSVATAAGHVVVPGGAGTAITNYGLANQAGCENPMGLDFVGTINWTPPVVTTWCSPGFWKNNGRDLWTQYYTKKYSTLVGAAPLGKKAPAGYDPTLLDVIDNPQIYGGEATNSVADFLSNKAFGTPIGSGVESCPGPGNVIVH
jgi:hypothetical protein